MILLLYNWYISFFKGSIWLKRTSIKSKIKSNYQDLFKKNVWAQGIANLNNLPSLAPHLSLVLLTYTKTHTNKQTTLTHTNKQHSHNQTKEHTYPKWRWFDFYCIIQAWQGNTIPVLSYITILSLLSFFIFSQQLSFSITHLFIF